MHGTTIQAYEAMLETKEIRGSVYLTDCQESALYYARAKHRKHGGEMCILFIKAAWADLEWDCDSFIDPIKPIKKKHQLHTEIAMRQWWRKIDGIEKTGLSAQQSLALVNAVFSQKSLPATQIINVSRI